MSPRRGFLSLRRRAAPSVLALALSAALSACGSTEPDTPVISGTWTGRDSDGGSWRFDLSEDAAGAVSGTCSITDPSRGALSGSIAGTHEFPALSLDMSITFSDSETGLSVTVSCDYRATVSTSGDAMSGTMNCLGASGRLDLSRA